MSMSNTHRTINAIWRIESAKLIAGLTRIVRDVGVAEDIAHDAFVIALEKWPQIGIPDNPGAWLMTTAKRRAIDLIRRTKLRDQKYSEVACNTDLYTEDNLELSLDEEIGDDAPSSDFYDLPSGVNSGSESSSYASFIMWAYNR